MAGEAGVPVHLGRVDRTSSRCTRASARPACGSCSARRVVIESCIVFIDELDAVGRNRGGNVAESRRARADAQPAARRDGRLLAYRQHRRRGGDQPCRHPRFGAAPAGTVRSSGHGRQSRSERPRADPARAHAHDRARTRRGPAIDRARDAGLLRRRSRQPRQRGGAHRGAARTPHGDAMPTCMRRATRC